MATAAFTLKKEQRKRQRAKGAYLALLIFSALYFGRPEDVIPGLILIPMAKISGGIALVGLILSLMSGKVKRKFAPETKYVIAMFGWYCITIPFAYWRGGAFNTVMNMLSKSVIVAVLVALLVREFWQLKRLVWVQAAAVAMMTVASVALHRTSDGRLVGALGGVFENPNDLAINIALNWPICIAFFFMGRGLKKGLWAFAVVIMLIGVELTYSRSGFLAVALAAVLVVWQFAIRERKFQLVLVAVFLGMIVVVAMPSHFTARIASIVTGNQVDSMDRGSMQERKNLLIASVNEALHNPIFGVGAGNFQATAGSWHVAHNTYTEIAAEAGFPAAVLFLMILYRTVVNLRLVRKSRAYATDAEVRMLAGGLWVSVAAYLVSAFFASTEYNLYPYFLVAYTTALYQITLTQEETAASPAPTIGLQSKYGRTGAREPVWIR
ncbi:MAG TPA: O-antigen ligase family protein [Terriglobales bacterium]|nr:O-antigen ligase family protein [Terriglobales bacterium]